MNGNRWLFLTKRFVHGGVEWFNLFKGVFMRAELDFGRKGILQVTINWIQLATSARRSCPSISTVTL